ncbi:MAG TPA: YkgJ family cysteine cluster protein [Methylomirabilota bacterium]|nr:YkgJ family cysteine cluster protein [Methylomirabilota bacterium]
MAQDPGAAATPDAALCQSCGACCAYSHEWPRFTLEDEAEIARIPRELIADDGAGMKCAGERCTALAGEVGVWTACTVYDVRPHVCRACEPGDDACRMARERFGLRW